MTRREAARIAATIAGQNAALDEARGGESPRCPYRSAALQQAWRVAYDNIAGAIRAELITP